MTLVLFELLGCSFSLHSCIAPCFCKIQRHGLAVQLESVDFVDGILSRLDAVKDDESLSFALQTGLGNNVDNGSIFFEDLAQRLDQLGDLDALRQVPGLDDATVSSAILRTDALGCDFSTYVDTALKLVTLLRLFVRSAMYERCVWRGSFVDCRHSECCAIEECMIWYLGLERSAQRSS